VAWPGGQVLIWLEEYAKARDVLVRLIEAARAKSAPTYLPYTLTGLAELEFRNGAWPTAQANVSEAVRLAEETAQPAALGFALATLARIEAAQGREDDCRGHVRRASELAAIGVRAIQTFADSACGLLELGLGRCEEAVARLEPIAQATLESGLAEPAVIQWAPDLIEAYVRCGRTGEARAAVTRFEQEARASGGHWALAAAARCKGLLADADVFERDFAEALSLHGQTPMPFERARTQLCFGERLRRSRRRTEGRVQLRASLEGFERLGAASWIERARSELRASGESLRRRSSTGREELTPQELQVAQFVARGDTNREVGAALFLSPKTVESHLSHIYRKLGVRSRTELAALLAGEAAGVHAHV
jgi:DNA-binding CsgD family transcriptional regulator